VENLEGDSVHHKNSAVYVDGDRSADSAVYCFRLLVLVLLSAFHIRLFIIVIRKIERAVNLILEM